MPRVIHFEISADNPERATKFYSNVFDWKIVKWDGPQPYWLITTGESTEPGIDGAIMNRMENLPPVVNTIGVPSIDEFMSKVDKNGGKVLMPKMSIPNIGYFTYCLDTEGNAFGIMEEDSSAK